MAGIEAGGDPLPQATLDSIKRTKLALKGPPDRRLTETDRSGGRRALLSPRASSWIIAGCREFPEWDLILSEPFLAMTRRYLVPRSQ